MKIRSGGQAFPAASLTTMNLPTGRVNSFISPSTSLSKLLALLKTTKLATIRVRMYYLLILCSLLFLFGCVSLRRSPTAYSSTGEPVKVSLRFALLWKQVSCHWSWLTFAMSPSSVAKRLRNFAPSSSKARRIQSPDRLQR